DRPRRPPLPPHRCSDTPTRSHRRHKIVRPQADAGRCRGESLHAFGPSGDRSGVPEGVPFHVWSHCRPPVSWLGRLMLQTRGGRSDAEPAPTFAKVRPGGHFMGTRSGILELKPFELVLLLASISLVAILVLGFPI